MKYSDLSSLEVYTDGGCSNNGNANGSGVVSCYGSFMVKAVTTKGEQITVKHEQKTPMPTLTTNNEAEYQALVWGLQYIKGLLVRANKLSVPIQFRMDSEMVFKQMKGDKNCKAQNLLPFYTNAKSMISDMKIDILQITGDDMKVVLGH